ncbi:hypothetical protein F4678DRAFT_462315 [Xylaria arbuscula]|nr:hypothetical protein F4678DRAFT_462315 [Xylaria arbuscula]
MQLTVLATSFFAALAASMPPPPLDWLDSKIPDCGRGCLNDGYKAVGCGIKEYQCQCDRSHDLFKMAQPCIDSRCSNKEIDRLNAASMTICEELDWGNSTWFNQTYTIFPALKDGYLKRAQLPQT